MKVYSKSDSTKKKNLGALIVGCVFVVCAIVITLCVTLADKPEPDNVVPANGDAKTEYVMPLAEYTLGQEFSDMLVYNATLKQWRTHNGVDFTAPVGSAVKAVYDGKVVKVETTTLEGGVVTIEQTDGLIAVYKSLSEIKVKEGDNVKSGDEIGKVDSVMIIESADGAHLHLEMKKSGEYVDPMAYLPGGKNK